MTGPIVVAFFMDLIDVVFYFWGIASFFGAILVFTLLRMNLRQGIKPSEQSHIVVGPIGTPIAEYTAASSLEYAEAMARHELEQLDRREDITERQL